MSNQLSAPSRFPTISDVIVFLRLERRDSMALAVEMLEIQLQDCRRANEANLQAVNELRAKHEPKPFRYADHRSPPDSDG